MLDGRRPAIDERVVLNFLTAPTAGPFDDPGGVIPARWRQKSPDERRDLFATLLAGFLDPDRSPSNALLVVAEPGLAALVFFGILRLVPSLALLDTLVRRGYDTVDRANRTGAGQMQTKTVVCQVWEGPTVGLDTPRPVPEGFDYDMWLGPTAWHPYTAAYVNGWNYFWDTGAGPVIGMGCHYTDIAQWGLQRDDTGPVTYEGTATWKPDAFSETPVTADCCCTYADGVKIIIRSSGAFQDRYIRFVGTEGWIQVDDETNNVTAEPKSILRARNVTAPGWAQTGDHVRDWLDCIKSRRQPICHPESAQRATTICHAANIGLRLGRSLKWDPQAECFLDDAQANAMLLRAMRPPWSLL